MKNLIVGPLMLASFAAGVYLAVVYGDAAHSQAIRRLEAERQVYARNIDALTRSLPPSERTK